ncbi:MAG: rhomboid family intramembrane serine protease [Burkholderiaceae bacterium]
MFVLTPDPRRPDRRRWGIGLNPARPQISLQSLKPPDQQRAFDLIQTRLNSLRQARGQGETASAVEARRAVAFEQRLATMTPVTWALYLVVAANVVVWFANLAAGMHALKPAPAELFAWGANSAHAVVRNHEYWRLFTAMFLHIGLMHLALNMLGLWEAGRQLCRWLGNARFLLIYIGSGLVGSALSLHFSSQQSVSVGASGAVFGVLGALLTTVLQYRSQLPKVLSQKLLTGQGVFMAYALVQGLGSHGVDNAAHVGGLMAGALLAWLLPNNIEATAFDGRRRFGASAAVGACVLAITALISTTGGAGVDHRNAFAAAILLQRLAPELQLAEQALQQDIQRSKAGQLTDAALADAIEQHHLPAYRALRTQLDSVVTTLTAANDAQRLSAIRDIQAHTAILTEMLELEITKARSTGADADVAEQRAKQLAVELAAVSKRIAQRQLSGEAGKKRL